MAAGGVLYATAGALGRNEFNMTSAAGAKLLGPEVAATSVYAGAGGCKDGVQDHRCMITRVQLEKQDLPFVDELDVVTLDPDFFGNGTGNTSAPMVAGVYGEKAMLKVQLPPAAAGGRAARVVANFSDGSPAALVIPRGKGTIWYTAFHPGLAYFRTALPDTEPPCKGSTDENSNHRVTTGFSPAAAALALAPLAACPAAAGAGAGAGAGAAVCKLACGLSAGAGMGAVGTADSNDAGSPLPPARPVSSVPPLVEVGVVTYVDVCPPLSLSPSLCPCSPSTGSRSPPPPLVLLLKERGRWPVHLCAFGRHRTCTRCWVCGGSQAHRTTETTPAALLPPFRAPFRTFHKVVFSPPCVPFRAFHPLVYPFVLFTLLYFSPFGVTWHRSGSLGTVRDVGKRRVTLVGWVFFSTPIGSPHVRPMGVHCTRAGSQTKSN